MATDGIGALGEALECFGASFNFAPVGMAAISVEPSSLGRFLRVNPALCTITGYSTEQLLATTFQDITQSDDPAAGGRYLDEAARGERRAFQIKKRCVHADGRVLWILLNTWAVPDASGVPLCLFSEIHEVTAEMEAEARLDHQRRHDALTGLPNRASFVDRLAQALERERRGRDNTAVFFLDLDRLRAVNDHLGYDAGSQLLVTLARRLSEGLRPNDVVARLGGDEFAILCENVADERAVIALAERALGAVKEPVHVGGERVSVTATVGVAFASPDSIDALSVLGDAELAMRRAKELGTAGYELFSAEMRSHPLQRIEKERALQRALEEGQFRLLYQPMVALDTERAWAAEALLRWEHPERGTVPPLEFIPLAEETGLIVPIGAWVLEEAAQQAARWNSSFPERLPLRVSVNVSGRQFQAGLVDTVRDALDRSQIDPGSLCLEVTESIVMDDVGEAVATLTALKALGVAISIDDFGTGYSSLAYLRRFPLDELKVDRSFVDGLGRDAEDTAIVAAVTAMAHALELNVVAEGVETAEQLDRLRLLGCDFAQGYHLARPQPAEGVGQLLADEEAASNVYSRVEGSGTGLHRSTKDSVVIADDSPDVLMLAEVSLASAGFEVHTANSGEGAISLVRAVRPTCVVLDVTMPDLSGVEVCRELRADPSSSGCTIVMLTANELVADKVEAFSAGADDYMLKPFSPRDLVSRVRAAVRRKWNGSHSAASAEQEVG